MNTQNAVMIWFTSHLRAIGFAYNELIRSPLSTLITICLIAIAVTLPTGFYVAMQNLNFLHQHWESQSPTISLYIRPNTPEKITNQFIQTLKNNKNVAQVRYYSPAEGLKRFENSTGLKHTLDIVGKNPLPGVLVILPTLRYQQPDKINFLLQAIKGSPIIDNAQVDMAWVKRLYYLVKIGNKVTTSLAVFFGISVFLIIISTIRNMALKHEKEIEILKLLGATQGFIHRPLMYFAVICSLLGGLVATCITSFFIWMLTASTAKLAQTYHSQLALHALSFGDTMRVLVVLGLLALIGSWFVLRAPLKKRGR